jgi:hypothetical protein
MDENAVGSRVSWLQNLSDMTDLETYRVFLTNWEIECCGAPPVPGQRVNWHISLRTPEAGPAFASDPELVTDLSGGTIGAVRVREHSVPVVRKGELVAGIEGEQSLQGLLCEGHHETIHLPLTPGVVQRVSLLLCEREQRDGGVWHVKPGTVTLKEVDASPKWFRDGRETGLWEEGVLVDLEVPT